MVTREQIETAGLGARYELAWRRFSDFLDFVTIEDPPPGGGLVPFEKWPHLVTVAELLSSVRLLIWLKAKQIGASWEAASYADWVAGTRPRSLVGLFSKGEAEALELLRKCRTVYLNLPPALQVPLAPKGMNNLGAMEYANGSRILAFPSTEAAGIGYTFSVVVMDEADFHPYFEQNYAALKPTIDAGGQLLILSTSNPYALVSGFKTLFQQAPGNGFHPIFYGWEVRPGRDQAWYDRTLRESIDKALTQRNYPNSAEEALAPPQTLAAFDLEALVSMREDAKRPMETRHEGITHIFQKYAVGKRYCAFSDTAHGVGQDFAVTAVLDAGTGYVVADVVSNVLDPRRLALYSSELLRDYRNPIWAIEDNDWGISTLETAQELDYPNLFYREMDRELYPNPPKDKRTYGWHTDDRNRWSLWTELQEAVQSRLVTVPSERGLAQFFGVIRNPQKRGRIEATSGANDDYPFAVGGCWQMRKYAGRGVGSGRGVAMPRWV